jgi:hypothetical protein
MDMKNIIDSSTNLILPKHIQEIVPYSNVVDSRTFSRLLDDDKVVATYKMYWLLGILDEVSNGNIEIDFKLIISRMIVYAWYPIRHFKLSFGRCDNLAKHVNYVAEKENFPSNCEARELLDYLDNCEDSKLKSMMKELTYNVPYWLLSPFFNSDLKGLGENARKKMIVALSLKSDKCLYKIIKGDTDKIILNEGWADYLRDNYKLIKSWIYYKLVCFIQKRNPNVPAIAFKLEAPRVRKLNSATKLWNNIIANEDVKDIYTGEQFNNISYEKFGVLSLDHFIPWSFVLHDEMWNLVPTFKNINSRKSDNLLLFDNYIDDFCSVQYRAFSFLCNNRVEKVLEQYIDIMRLDNPYDYYKYSSEEKFNLKMKQCISPLYQIAVNQGFQIVDKLF